MRLSVPQSLLAEHLQMVAKAVPQKSTIPVLEGILFESDGKRMTLTANNLELGIQTSFPVSHIEGGRVVLPAKITDIIRRLPGEAVQLSVNQDNFMTDVKSGQTEFQLYGLAAEDFPSFPSPGNEHAVTSFEVNAAELRRALRQTLFAVSHDEGKTAFTGVLFALRGEKLTLSASDTFRLANTSCIVTKTAGKQGDILVPARILQEVVRIFSDDESVIKVDILQNQMLMECNDVKVASRLLDENYPNVERVIPKEFSGQATLDVNLFQRAVERASLLAEGVNHVIRLSFGEGALVIRAASKYGRIQEQVEMVLEGEGMEISLNVRFLLDMLKICEGEKCVLQLTGPFKPCILRDSLDEDYLYLVLPVKT